MLRAILNKSWRQQRTKQQLYAHRPSITKTIQVRRTRHLGHSSKSKDELISDILLWTPSHERAKAERPAITNIQQLCADTGHSPENLPGARDHRDVWRERVKEVRASSMTWWYYLPTSPLGQDMTQGQFFSGVWIQRFEFRVFLLLD